MCASTHTAPTLDIWRRSAAQDKDGGHEVQESNALEKAEKKGVDRLAGDTTRRGVQRRLHKRAHSNRRKHTVDAPCVEPAGLIIAGMVAATLRTVNPRFGGPVPEAARSFLENVGLDLFVTGRGLNVASALLAALSQGRVVAMVVLIGMIGALVPPFVSWLVGLYIFKMDPILLAGAVAGSRSSTTAMKAMQDTSKSSVPAFGYPVPYALSAVIVLIFAYLAMVFY